ncbi:CD63 antigen-like [Apostichopus japonicus]|uniref:CD63 antigen-like n=1 Tax=Stichopus japonicus TaxID=307972 RepID=UPI003AB249DD
MAQGVNKLVKFMLFCFNFVFFLSGLLLIVISSLFLANFYQYEDFTGASGTIVIIAFIVIGAFFFVTGFFGCCGALRENYCMLFMYATIIFILLLLEIVAGVVGFVLRDEISKQIDVNMGKLMKDYSTDNVTALAFDDMQHELKCCGTNNFTDWFGLYGPNNNSVPPSCCIKDTCDNTDVPETKEEAKGIIYVEGCSGELKNLLLENMMTITIICIVIGLVEITGIFCACCLMKSVKNEYEVV